MEFTYSLPERKQPQGPNQAILDALGKNAVGSSADKILDNSVEIKYDSFDDILAARYTEMEQLFSRHLPALEDLHLPKIGEFLEKAESLSPIFDYMKEKGWEPDVVFVPQQLPPGQWEHLLTGWVLDDGTVSRGIHHDHVLKDGSIDRFIPTYSEPWDVVVMSSTEKPIFDNVSPSSWYGANADVAAKEIDDLAKRFNLPFNNLGSFSDFVPSYDAYMAAQLLRLQRYEQPFDGIDTASLVKEEATTLSPGVSSVRYLAIFADWRVSTLGSKPGMIETFTQSKHYTSDGWGIRPTLSANYLHYKSKPHL